MPSTNTVFHLQWICCQVRWYGLHAQGARREGRPQPACGQPGVARQGVDSGHVRHAQSWHGMMACHIHARLALLIPRQRQFFLLSEGILLVEHIGAYVVQFYQ